MFRITTILFAIYFSFCFLHVKDAFAAKGELQYCFYKGRWSQIFKKRKNYIDNTRWCKIIQKSDNPNLYNDIFKKSIGHSYKWWIETKTLERIVAKYEFENEQKNKSSNNNSTLDNLDIDQNSTVAEQLEQLAKLYENGILNEQEFNKAKKIILDGN